MNPRLDAAYPAISPGRDRRVRRRRVERDAASARTPSPSRASAAPPPRSRAAASTASSWPCPIPQRKGDPVLVARDEHPRPDTTAEALAKLKPAFRAGGTVTAGNASGINDGAAAALLVEADRGRALGLRPMARVLATAVAGVDPRVMGIGPVPAIRKALERAGLAVDDLDVVELNEAFASQSVACIDELGLDPAGRQPERRRDRAGASARGVRGAPRDDAGPRAGPHRRPLWPRLDVHRRRPGDRHRGGAGRWLSAVTRRRARGSRLRSTIRCRRTPCPAIRSPQHARRRRRASARSRRIPAPRPGASAGWRGTRRSPRSTAPTLRASGPRSWPTRSRSTSP